MRDLSSIHEISKECSYKLDIISQEIKDLEQSLKGIPLRITLNINENNEAMFHIFWCPEDQRLLCTLQGNYRPLIEHKAEVRIIASKYLDKFIDKVKEEYINHFGEKKNAD